MIEIKLQCDCGQRYAFDVEPNLATVPAIACPSCGADGTGAARQAIAEKTARPAVAKPVVRVATPVPAAQPVAPTVSAQSVESEALVDAPPPPPPSRRLPGQVAPEQAKHEAMAKISWGDAPQEVLKYLMMQGFEYAEAASLIKEMCKERNATIRASGIRHLVTGSLLVCIPIVSLVTFLSIGVMPIKTMGLTVMLGLWGLWKVVQGIIKVVAPSVEQGDAAD